MYLCSGQLEASRIVGLEKSDHCCDEKYLQGFVVSFSLRFVRCYATKEEPLIYIDQKVFICFDAPNLVKSLRNNSTNTKLELIVNNRL